MTENLYKEDCIRTFTGKYMNVFNPTPDMICIKDIAHALANQPRFGGHLPKFYSVAEHSLNVWRFTGFDERLTALMHDASEAYLMDIPSPIKKRMPEYKIIEHNLMMVIAEKFGFEWPVSKYVGAIDTMVLELEWEQLMLRKPNKKQTIERFPEAKLQFINTFRRMKQR